MPDVFISYKRQERQRVEKLAAALEQLKLDVWFDAELNPGDTFLAAINDALLASRVILVCWTPEAARSPFVLGEAEHGRARNALVAAFFQSTELPPPFNMVHAEDLSAWAGGLEDDSPAWRKIVVNIGMLTQRPGLLDFIVLSGAQDAAALRRWASDNWKDPLSPRAFEIAREIEAGAPRSGAMKNQTQAIASLPDVLAKLGDAVRSAWAADDDGQALVNCGLDYLNGFGVAQDAEAARVLFESASQRGAPAAWHNLGLIALQGRGVKQDYAAARRCFERAAGVGQAAAMVNLGFLHENGLGTPRDYAKARAHYERAAALGEAMAIANLAALYSAGRGVRQDWAEARRLFERAAQMGNASALDNLGTIYAQGLGVTPNPALARQCYESAAAQGDRSAIYNLGVFHLEGAGGTQDLPAALACFERAANMDHPSALANLGTMYAKGVGVWPDANKAKHLYERAGALGAIGALLNLAAMLTERGSPHFDPERARDYLREAYERGDEMAGVRLAVMLAEGEGGLRDLVGARNLLQQTARQSADHKAGSAARVALRKLEDRI